MNSRTKARLRALEVLFEADQRNEDYIEVLRRRRLYTVAQISAYSEEIIRGVRDHDEEIREFVETYARDWSFERMPAVDRAVLRIGTWELLYNDEVPDAVAISEAVGLARVLSTNDGGGFLCLGRVWLVQFCVGFRIWRGCACRVRRALAGFGGTG